MSSRVYLCSNLKMACRVHRDEACMMMVGDERNVYFQGDHTGQAKSGVVCVSLAHGFPVSHYTT